MKKTPVAIGLAILAVVLAGVVWWFWSLGSLPSEESAVTRLVIGKGAVFIMRAGTELEETAASGMELKAGDKIRTGQSSTASIVMDGRADIRLDENATVTVEKAEYPWPLGMVTRIKLNGGRIWTRLLRLLDADQSFEIQANDTVATVRGTSLATVLADDGLRLMVDHGGIVAKRLDAKNVIVGGQWFQALNGAAPQRGAVSSSTWRDDSWAASQREADMRFAASAAKTIADRAAAGEGLAPDEWLYALQGWSEAWHLRFAGQDAPQLYGRYLGRRLYQVRDLILRGKSGMAYHLLTETEDNLSGLTAGKDGGAYRVWSRLAIGRMLLSLADVPSDDALYRLKLRLEEDYVQSWAGDLGQELYGRSLGTDARLDEAETWQCDTPAHAERLQEAIRAADQSAKRVASDAQKAKLEQPRQAALSDKWDVQALRLQLLEDRLKGCLAPAATSTLPTGTATSTDMAATSTSAETPSSTGKTPTVTPVRPSLPTSTKPVRPVTQKTLGLVRIELFAQPNPANVGDKVVLYVKGYLADGSTMDATPYAVISESGGLGALSGSTYMAAKAGTATFVATEVDGTEKLQSRVSLQIGASQVSLSSLRLGLLSGSTTVQNGQSRVLVVTAVYSNGYTQTVTASSKFSVDGTAGTVSGSTFTAAGQLTGPVTVTAHYTEDGVSKTADLTLNVVSFNTKILQ